MRCPKCDCERLVDDWKPGYDDKMGGIQIQFYKCDSCGHQFIFVPILRIESCQ